MAPVLLNEQQAFFLMVKQNIINKAIFAGLLLHLKQLYFGKMKIQRPIPSNLIADFVHSILVIENFQVTHPFVLPLYANGSPTLLFQNTKGQIKGTSNHLTLFGQTVLPETLTLRNNFIFIAYFFKPYSLFSLFGLPAQALTDNPIDLYLLEPSKACTLQEQLLNAGCISTMLKLLDEYVYSLITKVKSDIKLIQFATTRIRKNHGKEVLRLVQDELYLTERTFQRMFEKNIGVSPNQYRRICQFNAAFQQLQQKGFENLSDIAFENGYADQSHYIRAFKEFTNIKPKDYLEMGKRTQD